MGVSTAEDRRCWPYGSGTSCLTIQGLTSSCVAVVDSVLWWPPSRITGRRTGQASKQEMYSFPLAVVREFASQSADAVQASLIAPVVLVFVGFIGKLHAEVRLKYRETTYGFSSHAVAQRGMGGLHCCRR